MEVWADIPGFEGYQISDQGRVRSCRMPRKHTYSLGNVWRQVSIYARCMAVKSNHWRPVVVIRKFGERKTYTFQVSRLMWEVFKGPIPDGMTLDHKDHNPFNNSWENLRVCTQQNNLRNKIKSKGKSSRYKGVYFRTERNCWVAAIKINERTRKLGSFNNEEDAARKYDEVALREFKEFACLNFPEEAKKHNEIN